MRLKFGAVRSNQQHGKRSFRSTARASTSRLVGSIHCTSSKIIIGIKGLLGNGRLECANRGDQLQAGAHSALGVVLMRLRITEIRIALATTGDVAQQKPIGSNPIPGRKAHGRSRISSARRKLTIFGVVSRLGE